MIEDEIAALLLEGASERAIDETLQVPRRQVRHVRAQRGIPLPDRTSDHGTDARYQHGCPCDACVDAHRARNRATYHRAPKPVATPFPTEKSEALARMHQAEQDRTRHAATRHYDPWTPEEIAVALDYTLSATEVADQLGRSRAAVIHARRRYAPT